MYRYTIGIRGSAYVPFLHHYIFNVNYMLYKYNQSVIDASLIFFKAAVE